MGPQKFSYMLTNYSEIQGASWGNYFVKSELRGGRRGKGKSQVVPNFYGVNQSFTHFDDLIQCFVLDLLIFNNIGISCNYPSLSIDWLNDLLIIFFRWWKLRDICTSLLSMLQKGKYLVGKLTWFVPSHFLRITLK